MKFTNELNINDFIEMEKLESKFYSSDNITPFEESYRWYEKYPYTICALKDNEKIIGFINMFLIKDYIFEQISKGIFNDKDLVVDDIVDINNINTEIYNMFLCCIIIDVDYRNRNLSKLLLKEATSKYNHIKENINHIITDNITDEGEKFSRRLGFKKLTNTIHNSSVYIHKYKDFLDEI